MPTLQFGVFRYSTTGSRSSLDIFSGNEMHPFLSTSQLIIQLFVFRWIHGHPTRIWKSKMQDRQLFWMLNSNT